MGSGPWFDHSSGDAEENRLFAGRLTCLIETNDLDSLYGTSMPGVEPGQGLDPVGFVNDRIREFRCLVNANRLYLVGWPPVLRQELGHSGHHQQAHEETCDEQW